MRILLAVLSILCLSFPLSAHGEQETTIYAELWGYRLYEENGMWGIMDSSCQIVVQTQYDQMIPQQGGRVYITEKRGQYGMVFLTDAEMKVISAIYDDVKYNRLDDIWEVSHGGAKGAYSSSGELLIDTICETNLILSDGICVLSTDMPFSFYSLEEGKTYHTDWEYVSPFSEGVAVVKKNGLYGYINRKNQCLIECKYASADMFYEGLAWVEDAGGTYYVIDQNEKVHFQSNTVYPQSDYNSFGVAGVYDACSERYKLIDKDGRYVADGKGWIMEGVEFDEYGYLPASEDDKTWGIINSKGETVIPYECIGEYRYMLSFYNGIAVIAIEDQDFYPTYRAYSADGTMLCEFTSYLTLVPDQYECGLLLIAESEDVNVYIDAGGNAVLRPDKEGVRYIAGFHDGLARIEESGSYGYIDASGRFVIPSEYSAATDFQNGFATVQKGSDTYYINLSGEITGKL